MILGDILQAVASMKSRRCIILVLLLLSGCSAQPSMNANSVVVIDDIGSEDEAERCERQALAGDQIAMLRLWRYAAMEHNNRTESNGWLWLAAKHGNAFARKELVRLCNSISDINCVAQWIDESE